MNIAIIGAGGHGLSTVNILPNTYKMVGFIDDFSEGTYEGFPILGKINELKEIVENNKVESLFVAIGNNTIRQEIVDSVSYEFEDILINVISSEAKISPMAEIIGKNIFIGSGAYIGPSSKIKSGALVNTNATIEHHNVIGEFSTVAPSATLSGNVNVGELANIGVGAVVIQQKKIGNKVVIGGGCVVIEDCLKGTYVGVPARKVK